jgi:hypothetical protein
MQLLDKTDPCTRYITFSSSSVSSRQRASLRSDTWFWEERRKEENKAEMLGKKGGRGGTSKDLQRSDMRQLSCDVSDTCSSDMQVDS